MLGRVTSARCLNKMFLAHILLQQQFGIHSQAKVPFWDCGFQYYTSRDPRGYSPPMNWVIGIQILVLAVDHTVVHELVQASLSYGLGTVGEPFLDNHS